MRSPELEAIMTRWIEAMARSDNATMPNLFAPIDSFQYIGTDESEWWSGTDVRAVFSVHMDQFPDFRVELPPCDVEAHAEGSTGWGRMMVYNTVEGGPRHLARATMVFRLINGDWRAVQVHNSIGVLNNVMSGIELTQTMTELLASLSLAPVLPEGMVTLVFTDIEDSTVLAATLGDQRWSEVIGWHDARIAEVTRRHGGTVIKSLGDGSLVSFGGTRNAIRACAEIREIIQGPESPTPLKIRIGAHAGDVVESDDDVLGITVNKAARITSAADGGEIVISSSVHAMLSDSTEFEFGTPTETELRGLPGTHLLYRLES